jgi:hypothetical protein
MGRKIVPSAHPVDVPMDTPFIYEIHVEGHLTDALSNWFEDLAIQNEPTGETMITGLLGDQAALFGVLNKIQALNLTLISVVRLPPPDRKAAH